AFPGSENPILRANCRQTSAQPRECSQKTIGSKPAVSRGRSVSTEQDMATSRMRCIPSAMTAARTLSIFCHCPNRGEFASCRHWAVNDLSCEIRSTTCWTSSRSNGCSMQCKRGVRTTGSVGIWSIAFSFFNSVSWFCTVISHLATDVPLFRFHVRGCRRQVHQLEVIRDAVQRFRVPQKQISMRQQVVIKMLDYAHTIEINQHVAAHDQIDALHERHAGIVEQVQSLETDARLHFRIDLQQLTAGREIFLPEILREISSAVVSVYPLLGVRTERSFKSVAVISNVQPFTRPAISSVIIIAKVYGSSPVEHPALQIRRWRSAILARAS